MPSPAKIRTAAVEPDPIASTNHGLPSSRFRLEAAPCQPYKLRDAAATTNATTTVVTITTKELQQNCPDPGDSRVKSPSTPQQGAAPTAFYHTFSILTSKPPQPPALKTSIINSGAADSQVVRRRRWAPKVPTGCLTCRARRIKCDEQKPACRRCTSTGRFCNGYTVDAPQPDLPHLTQQPVYSASPVGVYPTSRERQIFDMFRSLTVKEITGGFDPSFWATDVLRAAQAHPAIWHAGLAFSALHQRMKISSSQGDSRLFAQDYYTIGMTQYNISIGHLIKLTRKPVLSYADKQAVVLASTMHYGLCCLQKQLKQATVHVANALNLFKQWKLWQDVETSSPGPRRGRSLLDAASLLRHVAYCFQDLEAIDFYLAPAGLAKKLYAPATSSTEPFKSITEATFALNALHCFGFMRGELISDVDYKSQQLPLPSDSWTERRARDSWKERFADIKESPRHQLADPDGLALLQLMIEFDETFHIACVDPRPEIRAALTPRYARLLDLAEMQLAKRSATLGTQLQLPPPPSFSFCVTPTYVVHMVGIVCRNRSVRCRSIDIQKRFPQAYGLWSSYVSAAIVEAKMNFESAGMDMGACACVPDIKVCDDHRSVDFDIGFETEGFVSITIKSATELRKGLPGSMTLHPL